MMEISGELRCELLYLQCGFDKSPSRQSFRWFLTDNALVIEDTLEYSVEQVAGGDLLATTP